MEDFNNVKSLKLLWNKYIFYLNICVWKRW